MKKALFAALFLGASGALAWLVWFRPLKPEEEEKKPEAEVPVHAARIRRTTLRSYVTAYGIVEPEPKALARLSVGAPGLVASVNAAEGQRVEQGAVLFELDGRTADVAERFAGKTLERQRKLAEGEGTSQKLLQDAEQQAEAARVQRALLQIRAPFRGTLTKVNTKAGEAADLTTVLGELVDLDRLTAAVLVSSLELGAVKAGQPAEVAADVSTPPVASTVAFVSPQVDPKTGAGAARVALPAGGAMRPGQFVQARIVVDERRNVLAAPLSGVAKDATGAVFIAVIEGDKAVLKPVKAGVRDGDWVEVEGEGVEEGKTVVTEGAYGLIMTQQFATKVRVVAD